MRIGKQMKILYGTAAVIGCLFMCHFGYTGEGKTDYSFKSEDLPAAYDLHMVTNDGLV